MKDYNRLSKLKNAVNDAEKMSKILRENLGAKVFPATNCNQEEYTEKETKFFQYVIAHPNALALLFYAGHAVEYKNSNRLLLISNADKSTSTITEDSVCLSKFIARWVLDMLQLAVNSYQTSCVIWSVLKVAVSRC